MANADPHPIDSDYVRIFDTTLRDGEQSPGCTMNVEEKISIARQLERLNVDVIEAGFAVSSPGDFESVSRIADTVVGCDTSQESLLYAKSFLAPRRNCVLIRANAAQTRRSPW